MSRRTLERREEVRDRFGVLLLLLVGAFVALARPVSLYKSPTEETT